MITGITDKSYTVTGLTQGGTFNFYVVANYVNGTLANSNTEEVTLINSDLEVYTPVMQPADESFITLTSFRADWTDATPEATETSTTPARFPCATIMSSKDGRSGILEARYRQLL